MSIDNWVNCFQIGAYTAAIGGIIFTAIGYFKNNKLKRGEWLKALFEKFYEQETYKTIRSEIEYDTIEAYLEVKDDIPQNKEREEQLVDCLNFFEFIAFLLKNGQIRQPEVNDMFGYYLRAVTKNTFLNKYIEDYDFENLEGLLKNYE